MTRQTQPRVYVRYAHPRRSDRPGGSCDMFSWIALGEMDEGGPGLSPKDPFDLNCPRCGMVGEYGGKLTERLVGDPPSRYCFPEEIDPDEVLAGYPLLVTNHGYQLTS